MAFAVLCGRKGNSRVCHLKSGVVAELNVIHHHIATDEDRATATGNMPRKVSEVWTRDFCDMRADRQTDRRTQKPIATIRFTAVRGTNNGEDSGFRIRHGFGDSPVGSRGKSPITSLRDIHSEAKDFVDSTPNKMYSRT